MKIFEAKAWFLEITHLHPPNRMNLSLIFNSINAFAALAVSVKVFLAYRRASTPELRLLFFDFAIGFLCVTE